MSDGIEVIHMTDADWNKALASDLNALGLTWEQLAAQARYREFESPEAKQLWLMAGPRGFTTAPQEDFPPPLQRPGSPPVAPGDPPQVRDVCKSSTIPTQEAE